MIYLVLFLLAISITAYKKSYSTAFKKCNLVPSLFCANSFALPANDAPPPRVITFVSSNKNKIREVMMILGENFPYTIKSFDLDMNELQATPVEISRNKCKQAAKVLQGPVMVEDTSLCFNALNGMPGPYVKWFYERIGNEGLYRLLKDFDDKTGE